MLVDIDPDVTEVVTRLGPGTLANQGDVRDEAFCKFVVETCAERLAEPTGLVHAAGVAGRQAPLTHLPLAEVRRVLEINLLGSFAMSQAVARRMSDTETRGAIVLLGSTGGRRGDLHDSAYAASKAGVHILAQVLALELGHAGIRVNAIAPGPIMTRMHTEYVEYLAEQESTTPERELEAIRDSIPIGRHGQPADVAEAAAWLLGGESGFVTGQTIGVDGGILPWS